MCNPKRPPPPMTEQHYMAQDMLSTVRVQRAKGQCRGRSHRLCLWRIGTSFRTSASVPGGSGRQSQRHQKVRDTFTGSVRPGTAWTPRRGESTAVPQWRPSRSDDGGSSIFLSCAWSACRCISRLPSGGFACMPCSRQLDATEDVLAVSVLLFCPRSCWMWHPSPRQRSSDLI